MKKELFMDWNKFNNLNMLVIDDDQFTRELILTMLKKVPNITLDQAANGIDALMMIENHKYDMYLLDLYMPRMSGEEFINNLKKNKQFDASAVVLITTDRLSKKELENIGANYYLTKPFDFHNFVKNIYGFLEQESLQNET